MTLNTEKIIEFFLEKNILLSHDIQELLSKMNNDELEKLMHKIDKHVPQNEFFVLDKHSLKEIYEKDSKNNISLELINKNINNKNEELHDSCVKIISSYDEKSMKREVSHFVQYFRQRYKTIEQMLSNRKELQNRMSISRLKSKKEKEKVSVIGMVKDIRFTKNNNLMINIEDLTSTMNIVISKSKGEEFFQFAKTIVLDEVIGVEGTINNGIIFVNNIIMPDIPLTKEFKKSPNDEYVAFIGDPHFGSKHFLTKEFEKLIKWFNGKIGDEKQKEISSKIKYLVIVGDLVDGVGTYPSQEEDLDIPSIYGQYDAFANAMKRLPSHIQIIICPGNHDAMRISEPQPAIYEEFAKELYNMKNVVLVSNPSIVNIGATKGFMGFDMLLYHGYSFPYYADNIESVRVKGGLERADLIMECLLKKRHLAPSHTSTLYIPDTKKDPLVIEKIPDIFVTGHIHRTTAKNFNNITLLNCSCWIGQTPYQEKVGLKPQPARLPLLNLKTREIKILKFGKEHYTLDDNLRRGAEKSDDDED